MSAPYYDDGAVTIYCGDCREILPEILPAATERQDETRPRIEQTRPGRDWLDRVERIGRGGR